MGPRLLPIAVLCALLALPARASAVDGEIRIGGVWSLSGVARTYGEGQVRGAALAVEEINRTGMLAPATLRLMSRNDASTPANARTLFEQLITRDGATAMLGPTLSGSALQADPFAQSSGIPVVAVSNTAPGITEMGDYIFRASLAEAVVQPRTVDVSQRRLKYKTAAIIYGRDDAYENSSAATFRAALKDNGVKVVADRSFGAEATSYGGQIRAVAKAKPQALIVSALTPRAVAIIKAARRKRALKNVPIIGGNAFNAPDFIEQVGDAGEGAISGSAWIASASTPGNRRFRNAFRARYGEQPDQFAAQAYTGVQLLAEAITRADSADPALVRAQLAGLTGIETVLGTFGFDADRNAVHDPVVQVIRGGQFHLLR